MIAEVGGFEIVTGIKASFAEEALARMIAKKY